VTAATFRDRLSSRLEPAHVTLTGEQVDLLDRYWRLLERWNSKINLTALPLRGYPAHSIDRLIVEPLMGAALMPPEPLEWYDLGSGGGSPAVPLKVLRPAARLTMVESRSRKAAFLREVLRNTGFSETARVENARLEEVARAHLAAADFVTIRAVRVDGALLDTIRTLLKPAGCLMLFDSVETGRELPGFQLFNIISVPSTGAVIRLFVPRGTKG
jgi:16S rRNA (guanine527-N7)-methyltransferase